MLLFCVTGLSRCQGLRSPSQRQQTGLSTLAYKVQRRKTLTGPGPGWCCLLEHLQTSFDSFCTQKTGIPQWLGMHTVHLPWPGSLSSSFWGVYGPVGSPLWLLQGPTLPSGLGAVPSEASEPGHQTWVRTAINSVLEEMPKPREMGVLI